MAEFVKEQDESIIQLVAEIDSTINKVCEKVKNDDLCPEYYDRTISALAALLAARALLK